MVVDIGNACLLNVWEESFEDRETHQPITFYRALVSVIGEAPMQFGVNKEDFETLRAKVGTVGNASVDLDAQPGRRMRVRLIGME